MENLDIYDPIASADNDGGDGVAEGGENQSILGAADALSLADIAYFCSRLLARKTHQIISRRILKALQGELVNYSPFDFPEGRTSKDGEVSGDGDKDGGGVKKTSRRRKSTVAAMKSKAQARRKRSKDKRENKKSKGTPTPPAKKSKTSRKSPKKTTIGTQTDKPAGVAASLSQASTQFEMGEPGGSMPFIPDAGDLQTSEFVTASDFF